jgi:hypothetical protein
MSYGAFMGEAHFERLKFVGFVERTATGLPNRMFTIAPDSSDFIPPTFFKDTIFIDCDANAMADIWDPPASWAKISDCGQWPCTAPNNVVVKFTGS